MLNEHIIQADGVSLATQAFGNPTDPPVLLIMGAMASMLWWPEAFCQRLAEQGRYVIRYDSRDTGRSTTYPPGEPGYTFDDLADDTARVLDGYHLPAAHIVGFSAGGMTGQLAALKHPDRVITLTVICTSPFDSDLHKQSAGTQEAEAATASDSEATVTSECAAEASPAPDLTDREQTVANLVESWRQVVGTAYPFDEAAVRHLAEQDVDRATNFASAANHHQITGGEAWEGRLGEITAPLLVLHGTADPAFSRAHGIEFAERVAGTTLIWLEGVGHELPEPAWGEIIAAIARHTDGAQTV